MTAVGTKQNSYGPKLLLVTGASSEASALARQLQREGILVSTVATADAAVRALRRDPFRLIMIDLVTTEPAHVALIAAARAAAPTAHLIVLSPAVGEIERVRVFALGADDLVVKPFFGRELMGRVRAAAGRHVRPEHDTTECGPLALRHSARQVTLAGSPLHLTPKEFDLLAHLIDHPRETFSRAELLKTVWQSDAKWQQAATVTEHIRRLRAKIERDPRQPSIIRTVRGRGYRIDPPASPARVGHTDGGETTRFDPWMRTTTCRSARLHRRGGRFRRAARCDVPETR